MSSTPVYVELDELKNTLSLEGETFADDDMDLAIKAASRAVDEACYRPFYKSEDNEKRYFTPCFLRRLEIDDLLIDNQTEVAIAWFGRDSFNETWAENEHFVYEPLNAVVKDRPAERIVTYRNLPVGVPRSVRITGQWGWDKVPPQIKEATGILAAKLLRRARETPNAIAVVSIETGTALRISRSDPDVAALIEPFTREVALL